MFSLSLATVISHASWFIKVEPVIRLPQIDGSYCQRQLFNVSAPIHGSQRLLRLDMLGLFREQTLVLDAFQLAVSAHRIVRKMRNLKSFTEKNVVNAPYNHQRHDKLTAAIKLHE